MVTLRQNLLSDVTGLLGLSTLTELDMYDNELAVIPDFSKLSKLEYVAIYVLFWIYFLLLEQVPRLIIQSHQ